MSSRKHGALIAGVGAAACAVCCAGPILGFLAAIGLGTAIGFVAIGASALVIGAAIAVVTIVRRRRRLTLSCGFTASHQMFGSAE